jgi:TRAP-type C4-dicarboxylate transport system substrate-binding protein
MKKTVLIFLSLIMVIALIAAGCNGTKEPAPAEVPAESPTETPAAPPGEPPATPPSEIPAAEPPAEEVYELRMSTHYPPEMTDHLVASITEATGGRVEVVVYPASSLLDLKDTLTGLKDGICDIAMVTCETFPEAFPLNNVLLMPFMPLGDKRTSYQVWHKLQDEFPELAGEWGDFQVLFDDTGEGNTLHMVNFAAQTPEEMDGLRMFSGGTVADIMEDYGATPLYLEVPDWFTSLDRGLLDGMWLPWDAIWELKIYPLLPYHTTFPTAPGMLTRNTLFRMEAWNGLPADIQKIILDMGTAEREHIWATLDAKVAITIETVNAEGGTIVDLTPEQVNAWYEAAKPHHDAYLAKIDAMGLPATELYNRALELAQE